MSAPDPNQHDLSTPNKPSSGSLKNLFKTPPNTTGLTPEASKLNMGDRNNHQRDGSPEPSSSRKKNIAASAAAAAKRKAKAALIASNPNKGKAAAGPSRPNTRSQKALLEDSLNTSSEIPPANLQAFVGTYTYVKGNQLARVLDFGSQKELKDWFDSEVFAPWYNELYETIILPNKEKNKGFKGPTLKILLDTIEDQQGFGETRYTCYPLDKSNWSVNDWYAWCFLMIKDANIKSGKGIFYKLTLSHADMDIRIWQAMLRQNHIRSKGRSRKATKELELAAYHADPTQKPSQDLFAHGSQAAKPTGPSTPLKGPKPRQSTGSKQSSGSSKRLRFSSDSMIPPRRSPELVSDEPEDEDELIEGVRIKKEAFDLAKRKKGTSENPTQEEMEAAQQLLDDPQTDHPRDDPDTDTEREEEEPSGSAGSKPQTERLPDLHYLHRTMNPKNPLDCSTAWGRYATIHLTIHCHGDRFRLQRIVSGGHKFRSFLQEGDVLGEPSPRLTAEQIQKRQHLQDVATLTQDHQAYWLKEMEAITAGQRLLKLDSEIEDGLQTGDRMEAFLDNRELQPMDYVASCKKLNFDPKAPRFNEMKLRAVFKPWQVTGIARIDEIYSCPTTRAALLADSTGLGKTWQVLGWFHKLCLNRKELVGTYDRLKLHQATVQLQSEQWEDEAAMGQHDEEGNPHVVPRDPVPPPRAKPKLVLAPTDIIGQWYNDIRDFAPTFKPLVYYDTTTGKSTTEGFRKVEGFLEKKHHLFNGDEANSSVIVVSSILTMVARHGPSALKAWRIRVKTGLSPQQVEAMLLVLDPDWARSLFQQFDVIVIDEAHSIKNPLTMSNQLIQWMAPRFLLLVTASVLPNRIEDSGGYVPFIGVPDSMWDDKNLMEWGLTSASNPYLLGEDHPGAILQLTPKAINHYIIRDKIDKNDAGLYLRKIWRQVMIRRTYASPDPRDGSKVIGEHIARVSSRRIICTWTTEEASRYHFLAGPSISKLIMILKDGTLVWNRKHMRRLILLSTWTGWHWLEEDVHACSIKKWKEKKHLLWEFIKIIHTKQAKESPTGEAPFQLPDKTNVAELLRIVCIGSPKLRATLRIVAELVILKSQKLVIWSALPANQLLLHACFQALGIHDACYTSELNRFQRGQLVGAFTTDRECKIWNGNYFVGASGLNLQPQAHHNLNFDSPLNEGQDRQSLGRTRRVGQSFVVENVTVFVQGSFQDHQLSHILRKAVPGSIAELAYNVNLPKPTASEPDPAENITTNLDSENDEIHIRDFGKWYLINGEIVHGDDPRFNVQGGFSRGEALTPAELVHAIKTIGRGDTLKVDNPIQNPPGFEQWADEDLIHDLLANIEKLASQDFTGTAGDPIVLD